MRTLFRRLGVERLESRWLFAAVAFSDQSENIGSVPLKDGTSIEIAEMRGLRGAALEISFDHQRLQVDPGDVRAGSAWGGKGMSIANVNNDEGTINIFVFSARETELSHGSLVEIDFQRSDGNFDDVQPLIDVNRLRLNDTEVSFSDAEPTTNTDDDSNGLPKLSLQFKIAPEGESSLVPGPHNVNDGDVNLPVEGASQRRDDHRSDQQTFFQTALDGPINHDGQSEPIEQFGHYDGDVCTPVKLAGEHVDLAIDQWASSLDEFNGPPEALIAQDWLFHAPSPTIVDEEPEPVLEPLQSIWISRVGQRANSAHDFSLLPKLAIQRFAGKESGYNPELAVEAALQRLTGELPEDPTESESTSLAISRLAGDSKHR